MSPLAGYPFQRARDAFVEAYTLLDQLAASLSDEQLLAPTRCRGWAVGDLLCHLDFGMQEVLIGLASPTDRPADTDFASYWEKCCTGGDPDADLFHARFVRLVASAWSRPTRQVAHLRKLTAAALRQAEATDPDRRLEFQGHVLATGDFLATWVVEAAVHHLDLVLDLPDAPPPTRASLAVTRETLDAMLGRPAPVPWDDAAYAMKGTGRLPLSDDDRAALGPLAKVSAVLPLLVLHGLSTSDFGPAGAVPGQRTRPVRAYHHRADRAVEGRRRGTSPRRSGTRRSPIRERQNSSNDPMSRR